MVPRGFCGGTIPPSPGFFTGYNEAADNVRLAPRIARFICLRSVPRGWIGIKGVIVYQGVILGCGGMCVGTGTWGVADRSLGVLVRGRG